MKKIAYLFFALLLILIFAGCSSRLPKESYAVEELESMAEAPAERMMDFAGEPIAEADAMVSEKVAGSTNRLDVTENIDDSSTSVTQRKIIKTGSAELEVENLAAAEQAISTWVRKNGGYVESSSVYASSLYITLKVPAEEFDVFFNQLGDYGKVLSRNSQVEDVTRRYFDLENRIKNKRILQSRYQDYLNTAENVEDLLAVERSLNDVTTEIEQLEGSFKNLRHLISYSTIVLECYPPPAKTVINRYPSLARGFEELKYTLVDFFYGLFFVIIYIIVFGIPIVLMLGLLYLLTFGRVGLVKKLYRFLRGKTANKKKD